MNAPKITDVAHAALRAKNPKINHDPFQDVHGAMHLASHPAANGDLSKTPPIIGTSIHGELLVQITQNILYERRALYDDSGDLIDIVPKSSIDYSNSDEFKISTCPITIDEMKLKLGMVYASLKYGETLGWGKITSYNSMILAHNQYEKLLEQNKAGTLDFGISDQAIEYYMVRAELIRQQLENAGDLDKLQYETINEIDPKLFAVSKEDVIKALEEKHGGKFSIKTVIPQTNIFSKDALHDYPKHQNLVLKI